jgi:hypothetical protein
MTLLGTMRRSVGNSQVRRCAGAQAGGEIGRYLLEIDRFRRPGVTVQDHMNYGAGDKGVFVAVDKLQRDPEGSPLVVSVALLSPPAMDKNTFYLSSVIYAVDCISRQVDVFTLEDGVCICATLLFLCNIEPLVAILTSGALHSRWSERHTHAGRLLGLILHLITDLNGGINFGTGFTRRCQNFQNAESVTATKMDDVVDFVTALCFKSQSTDYRGCDDKAVENMYQEIITAIRKANGSRSTDGTSTLSHQHFVHALTMCNFLKPLSLTRFAKIASTTTHVKKRKGSNMELYLDKPKGSNTNQKQRLDVFQHALFLYLSDLYGQEVATHALLENIYCEANRNFPATDLMFLNQFFLTPWFHEGRYILMKNTPRYNNFSDSFVVESGGEYTGPRVSDYSHVGARTRGEVVLKSGGQAGTVKHYFLCKRTVGASTLRDIKKLLCLPKESAESPASHHCRIYGEVGSLPRVQNVIDER